MVEITCETYKIPSAVRKGVGLNEEKISKKELLISLVDADLKLMMFCDINRPEQLKVMNDCAERIKKLFSGVVQ